MTKRFQSFWEAIDSEIPTSDFTAEELKQFNFGIRFESFDGEKRTERRIERQKELRQRIKDIRKAKRTAARAAKGLDVKGRFKTVLQAMDSDIPVADFTEADLRGISYGITNFTFNSAEEATERRVERQREMAERLEVIEASVVEKKLEARQNQEKARREEKIQEAVSTGKKVVISSHNPDGDPYGEEIVEYAMPDGTVKVETRKHYYEG